MGDFLIYTLKSAIVLAFLFSFYKLTLGRKAGVATRRVSLLLIYISALLLPLLPTLTNYTSEDPAAVNLATGDTARIVYMTFDLPRAEESSRLFPTIGDYILNSCSLVMVAGIAVCMLLTVAGFIRIGIYRRQGRIVKTGRETIAVISRRSITPFSFGKTIYLSEEDFEERDSMVIAHESSHIRHRHYLDLLLARLTGCLMWWNPLAWIMLRELHDVHEFQADRDVISEGYDMKNYQYLLIRKAAGSRLQTFADSLNHSKLKKRFTMMKKSEKKGGKTLAFLMVPAMIAGGMLVSTETLADFLDPVRNVDSIFSADNSKPAEDNPEETIGKFNEKMNSGQETVESLFSELSETAEIEDVQSAMAEDTVNEKPYSVTTDSIVSIDSITEKAETGKGKPAIKINGVLQSPDFNMAAINSDMIKEISVIKNDEKFPNGVIDVILLDKPRKESNADNSDNVKVTAVRSIRKNPGKVEEKENDNYMPAGEFDGDLIVVKEFNNIHGTNAKILICPQDKKELDIKKVEFLINGKRYEASSISSSFSSSDSDYGNRAVQKVVASINKSLKYFDDSSDKLILTTSKGKMELLLVGNGSTVNK